METDIIKKLMDCFIDLDDASNWFSCFLVEGGEEVPKAYNKGIDKAIQVVKEYFNDKKTS